MFWPEESRGSQCPEASLNGTSLVFAVNKPGYLLPDSSTALPLVTPGVSQASLKQPAEASPLLSPLAMAMADHLFLGSQCSIGFYQFGNPEELAEFPGGRSMLGVAVGQMALCTAFGHNRNGPTGHVRHVKVIDALLVGQELKLPSCWPGVLGPQVISVPGCTSLFKRALFRPFCPSEA